LAARQINKSAIVILQMQDLLGKEQRAPGRSVDDLASKSTSMLPASGFSQRTINFFSSLPNKQASGLLINSILFPALRHVLFTSAQTMLARARPPGD